MRPADGLDQPMYFIDREHVGELLLFGDAQVLEELPVARLGAGVKELDAAVGQSQRGGGELLVVLEKQQIIAELSLGELIGGGLVVPGQLPHDSQVGLLGEWAESGQLEILQHAAAQLAARLARHA